MMITERWCHVPIIVVSCCSDNLQNVTLAQKIHVDHDLCAQINAVGHIYSSSLNGFNVDRVFMDAFKVSMNTRKASKPILNLPTKPSKTELEENLIASYSLEEVFKQKNSKYF